MSEFREHPGSTTRLADREWVSLVHNREGDLLSMEKPRVQWAWCLCAEGDGQGLGCGFLELHDERPGASKWRLFNESRPFKKFMRVMAL